MTSLKIKKQRQHVRSQIKAGNRNSLKCSKAPAEASLHRRMKFWVCEFCWDNDIEFTTEATIKNGRADIIIHDWSVIIEVLSSETIEDFKKKNYALLTIPLYSDTPKCVVLEMLEELKNTEGGVADWYRNQMLQIKG